MRQQFQNIKMLVSIPTRGNTLFRGHSHTCLQKNKYPRFNPHSGKHPVPGDAIALDSERRKRGFNPHSGKHPVPGSRIPSPRGDGCAEFQSPLGETPCSGGTTSPAKLVGAHVVSIPTRGNTLFRARLPPTRRGTSRLSFNPHSGKHPVPGVFFIRDILIPILLFQSPLGETPCSGFRRRPSSPAA